jgi:hypothetical protein
MPRGHVLLGAVLVDPLPAGRFWSPTRRVQAIRSTVREKST